MTAYRVYDVFTDAPFGGNQLAVIPDASALPDGQLQRIAREFNYSETTFVYPPADPANTARVRIFTPTMEVPFAGHPTIGTAVCLHDLGTGGDMVLELGVGPIACTVDGAGAAFTTGVPLTRVSTLPVDFVARTLSLPDDAVVTVTHPPTLAGVGLPFVLVELATRAALADCSPDIDAFREGARQYPAQLDFAVYAYCRDGDQIDARMFAPLDNIPEDPATGSAAAALAALLAQDLGTNQTLTIRQGQDMGRLSIITARTDAGGVTISGQAVLTMEGRLAF